MATAPALPKSIQQATKQRGVEVQQGLVAALKEKDFPKALLLANQLLTLEPNNAVAQQFQALLQEKAELAESSSGEEDDDEADEPSGPPPPAGAAAVGDAEGDSDEDDDDSDEDDDEDDDEEDEEDASTTTSGPPIMLTADELAAGLGSIELDPGCYSQSRAWRAKLRRKLTADVKALREKQLMAKMAADDPLLGA